MLVEYKIKLGPDGVTVTQLVDPGDPTAPPNPNGSPGVSSQGGLPGSYPGSDGGAGNPHTGPGGAGNPHTGPGGAGNPHTGPGGAGNPKTGPGGAGNPHTGPGGGGNGTPVIIFGPIILGGTLSCGQTPGDGQISQFPMQQQQESNWCWAAVSVSVDHYFSPQSSSTQCQVAAIVTGLNCCGGFDDCDLPEHLEDALQAVNITPVIQPPLTFDEVRQQIDAGQPVCVRIGWPDQLRGHFVVLCGYRELTTGEQLVSVADPFYPGSIVDFDEFNSNYQGGGQWTDSYLI